MRTSSTTFPLYLYFLIGSVTVFSPAFCCMWLVAITGFINDPLPGVLRVTVGMSLLGGLVGSILYWTRRPLGIAALYAIVVSFAGMVCGLKVDRAVQHMLAQWSDVHVYDQFGSMIFILPPTYGWGYDAILFGCIVLTSVVITVVLIRLEMLGRRFLSG